MLAEIVDLQRIQKTLCEHDADRKRVIAEGRQHVELLNSTVQQLQGQLQDGENLIGLERDRNQRLEEEISAIQNSNQRLVTMFEEFDENVSYPR